MKNRRGTKNEFDSRPKSGANAEAITEITRVDDQRFSKQLDELIAHAEDMRLKRMRQLRTRDMVAMNANIFSMMLGVGAFGWYFFMEGRIAAAVFSLMLAFVVPVFMHFWAKQPLKDYEREHKTDFMPKLAKALDGLSFYHNRGISEKILERLAVIPAYDRYEAEDCFMGMYKGVKVMLSEARLYSKHHKDGLVFDGIFVLLENSAEVIEGHTIITANHKMAKAFANTRWKTMNKVHVSPSNSEWDKFEVYSTTPEAAELMVGDRLLKELAEAGAVFDNAALTAVLFGKKFVFLMIPYDKDMFEASSIYVPVATKQHALQCKKEIEQLLEIIDVFDLYKPMKS